MSISCGRDDAQGNDGCKDQIDDICYDDLTRLARCRCDAGWAYAYAGDVCVAYSVEGGTDLSSALLHRGHRDVVASDIVKRCDVVWKACV